MDPAEKRRASDPAGGAPRVFRSWPRASGRRLLPQWRTAPGRRRRLRARPNGDASGFESREVPSMNAVEKSVVGFASPISLLSSGPARPVFPGVAQASRYRLESLLRIG